MKTSDINEMKYYKCIKDPAPEKAKLYVIAGEDIEGILADSDHWEYALQTIHGGECISYHKQLSGDIVIEWRDSLDEEYRLCATPVTDQFIKTWLRERSYG